MKSNQLANEFRPLTFNDVLGHERYVGAFKKMLRERKLPNVILIAGNAGTGKTTMARILAAGAMCKDLDWELGQPCGVCPNCLSAQGINDGPNYMHMDGAGSKLKEQVEVDLKGFLHSSPFGGARAKVCVADEAQALSEGAKNALLTLTENLPQSSFFIMTTTDPTAIDFAIRSRSFKIHLSDIQPDLMVAGVLNKRPDLLQYEESLHLIAEAANGCMREMWQLVQQLDSFDEPITADLAAWMTKGAKEEDRKKLWKHVEQGNFKQIALSWESLLKNGALPDRLGNQILEDVIELSAANPMEKDWAQIIRLLSQAQVLGLASGWKAALCSSVPHARQTKEIMLEQVYTTLFERKGI